MGDVTREEAAAIAEELTRGLPQRRRRRCRAAGRCHCRSTPRGARSSASGDAKPHPHRAARHARATTPTTSRSSSAITCSAAAASSRASPRGAAEARARLFRVQLFHPVAAAQARFVIGMQTQARAGAQKRWRSCARRSPISSRTVRPQTELEAAKQNIVGGFPLRIDSNRKIHEYLARDRLLPPAAHLSRRFREERRARHAASRCGTLSAARIDPERMVTVSSAPAGRPQ